MGRARVACFRPGATGVDSKDDRLGRAPRFQYVTEGCHDPWPEYGPRRGGREHERVDAAVRAPRQCRACPAAIRRVPGLPERPGPPGGSCRLPDLRMGGLLRQLAQPARQGALRGDRPPGRRRARAASDLAMVLCSPASRLMPGWRSPVVMGSCRIGHFACCQVAVDWCHDDTVPRDDHIARRAAAGDHVSVRACRRRA